LPANGRQPFAEDERSSGTNGWKIQPFVEDEPPSGTNGWKIQPFAEDERPSCVNGCKPPRDAPTTHPLPRPFSASRPTARRSA
jgi:hypothetical protein